MRSPNWEKTRIWLFGISFMEILAPAWESALEAGAEVNFMLII